LLVVLNNPSIVEITRERNGWGQVHSAAPDARVLEQFTNGEIHAAMTNILANSCANGP
jgi:hypothetical protein